ncbi:4-hydroxy-3-methylbut-2-enyl diphosphate reductase [mine drainage metagenome]|uniref:4-hydroxy-3-methylbut-2-enyl diphosphate reductase n=1 Tax=mine drainage metagenome TaxID=410659 RepID=A0A1J5SI01_9ZZZZ
MSTAPVSSSSLVAILAFGVCNRLAVRKLGSKAGLAFTGSDLAMAIQRLESSFAEHTPPAEYFSVDAGGRTYRVYFCQVEGAPRDSEIEVWSIERLESSPPALAPSLAAMVPMLDPYLIEIPYLHLGENDFIYKFRPEKERNTAIYEQDPAAAALYQSKLCTAIKALARQFERSAGSPVELNFGPVRYVIPSHFGFCLGVKNAIERAYETLAENPGKRVYMLSELIHNPFVNADLLRRGLRYLQTDKGQPITVDGKPASGAPEERLLWDDLQPDDIVVIPAFGATDEDKRRLVRKGIAVCQYDATCMLVEKVWKAARAYGREGYSVLIHGKHEHEETKATFSNTRRHAAALIVRNLDEAHVLGEIILEPDPAAARARFASAFAGRHTPEFDITVHLERIAVVNQTTLLSNETIEIIDYLREVYQQRYGDANRVGGSAKRDTLCYATQVNQDALTRALDSRIDAAFVIGGTNSSNTYQLFRLCEEKLGTRAFFIQSEAAIRSREEVDHFIFPAKRGGVSTGGFIETRPLWPDDTSPKRVLITGGASCPDGIIQQVINRINALFPADSLRSIDAVLGDLQATN